jgi:hypothetical protein
MAEVNRYTDNGDGGHSHDHWGNAHDYNAGKDPDQSKTRKAMIKRIHLQEKF